MKNKKLTQIKFVDDVLFKIESSNPKDEKKVFSLISYTQKGDYSVICKYKEIEDKSIVKGNKYNYACSKYLQEVQINPVKKIGSDGIYHISISSHRPFSNFITVTRGANCIKIDKNNYELRLLEYILNKLENKLDKFSLDFINLALETIKTDARIKQTPKCINDAIKIIYDLKPNVELQR